MTEEGVWAKDPVGRHRVKSGGELRNMNGHGRGKKLQPATVGGKQLRL